MVHGLCLGIGTVEKTMPASFHLGPFCVTITFLVVILRICVRMELDYLNLLKLTTTVEVA